MLRNATLAIAVFVVCITAAVATACDGSGPAVPATPTYPWPTPTPTRTVPPASASRCGGRGGISAIPSALWVVGRGGVLASADRGDTWRKIGPEGAYVIGIDVIDAQTGFVATDQGIFRTRDAGATWRLVTSRVVSQIEFADEQHGWAACWHYITLTEDGGATWSNAGAPCPKQNLTHLAFDELKSRAWVLCTGQGAGTFMTKSLFEWGNDATWAMVGDAPFPSAKRRVESWLGLRGNAWDLAVYDDVILIGYGRSPTVRLIRKNGDQLPAVIRVCNAGALSRVAIASETEIYVRGNLDHDGICEFGLYRSVDAGMTWEWVTPPE